MKKGLTVLGLLAVGLAVSGLGAVGLMLGAGVLHGYFPAVPALGYWQAYAVVWAAQSLQKTQAPK